MRHRLQSVPLLWRVSLANATVLVTATVALVLAPGVTVSTPLTFTELVILVCGTVAMMVLSVLLVRPAFGPLHTVADAMRGWDPLAPGARVLVVGGPDVATLARTFNEMVERLEAERRESARQALRVQEGERTRVARELHDEVGQTLTAMMLQIESLAAKMPEDLRDELDELRETARLGATDVRRIAVRLRPEALEDLGLQSALSALVTSFGEHAKLRIDRRLQRVDALSEEQELVIYRVAQEALTNVARHARASHVELSLEQASGVVTLRVRDDGRGLPPDGRVACDLLRVHGRRTGAVAGRAAVAGPEGEARRGPASRRQRRGRRRREAAPLRM
jgi:two-component system sensor histidine kinase UhpB